MSKTLSDFVPDKFNGIIFSSSVQITHNGHMHYRVKKIDNGIIRAIPIRFQRGEAIAEENDIGIHYIQHEQDELYSI